MDMLIQRFQKIGIIQKPVKINFARIFSMWRLPFLFLPLFLQNADFIYSSRQFLRHLAIFVLLLGQSLNFLINYYKAINNHYQIVPLNHNPDLYMRNFPSL